MQTQQSMLMTQQENPSGAPQADWSKPRIWQIAPAGEKSAGKTTNFAEATGTTNSGPVS